MTNSIVTNSQYYKINLSTSIVINCEIHNLSTMDKKFPSIEKASKDLTAQVHKHKTAIDQRQEQLVRIKELNQEKFQLSAYVDRKSRDNEYYQKVIENITSKICENKQRQNKAVLALKCMDEQIKSFEETLITLRDLKRERSRISDEVSSTDAEYAEIVGLVEKNKSVLRDLLTFSTPSIPINT